MILNAQGDPINGNEGLVVPAEYAESVEVDPYGGLDENNVKLATTLRSLAGYVENAKPGAKVKIKASFTMPDGEKWSTKAVEDGIQAGARLALWSITMLLKTVPEDTPDLKTATFRTQLENFRDKLLEDYPFLKE